MTTTASDSEQLRELDDGMRRAWSAYREQLRNLTGEEYEHAESASWTTLQHELRHLERRRASLAQNST